MTTAKDPDIHRATLRVPVVVYERAKFWAEKHRGGALSFNDFALLAIEEKIARSSGEIPEYNDLLIDRLNQLGDHVMGLSSQVTNLSTVVNAGFGTIMLLTKGDENLLLDDVDGELND